jgi:hypothetical protein
MNGAMRAPAMLAGAAIAGFLLWIAGSQLDRTENGGYWAAAGILAAAGLVFGLTQLRGGGGNPRVMLVGVFVPVLIVALWTLAALQPHRGFGHAHVLAWSGDIGIRGVVLAIGTWVGVLAFAVGATLAASLEPMTRRVVETPAPVVDREALDAPTTAEQREVEVEPESQETVVR